MILVCGDSMRDIYWHGEVKRISPEAPVPVISVQRYEERRGAAANVADNVKAMGVECLEEFGPQPPGQAIQKIRLLAKGQQVFRVDFDHPQKPVETLDLRCVKVLILVDYGKGTLGKVSCLIEEAKRLGVLVLVDPKGYDYEKYRGADVIKPNLDEMRVMVGGWRDEEDLQNKVMELKGRAGIKAVLLTRAAEGMTLYTGSGKTHIEAVAEKVVDVTGAGETAIAALGVGLHRGLSLEESMVLANKAAGIGVGKFGPSIVSKEELCGTS